MTEKQHPVYVPYVSWVTLGICIAVHLLIQFLFERNTTNNAILLGAYYKPFVIAGEWWRLLSVGFVHISIIHLFVNGMSLINLGRVMEKVMGRWQYAVILFGSVIGGTLFTFAAEGNTVAVGLSGGLYGLMAGYTYRILAAGGWKNPYVRNALIRTYMINILINFMPGIAVSAHLGGFIAGLILTAVLSEARHTKPFKVHFAISGCIYLFFLFFFVTRGFYIPDNQRFLGTDLAVLKMEKQAGLVSHAENMAKRLDLIYDINGSLENMLKED